MKAKITKQRVDRLRVGEVVADTEVRGFVARKLDSGKVTYGFRYRDRNTQRQRWLALGLHGAITADQARAMAKKRAAQVADYRDPVAEVEAARLEAARAAQADKNTVNAVLDNFLARYAKGMRSYEQAERTFKVYVRPRIGAKSIYDLRRRDIVEMLDEVEDQNGPVMADRVLAHVRKAFNWQAARDDQFAPPIVKGMARTKPKERARKRVLSDEEIRAVWRALDASEVSPVFARIVRTLMFTAQRRDEVSVMHRSEINGDAWIIPAERYKTGNANLVPVTAQALQWIGDGTGYLFSTTGGRKPFSGFSKAKAALNAVIKRQRGEAGLPDIPNWTLHDLRRTARTLMSRAGVPAEISERVLGHVISGVQGVYDRHGYEKEKREALEKLAALLQSIINPPADNVVALRREA